MPYNRPSNPGPARRLWAAGPAQGARGGAAAHEQRGGPAALRVLTAHLPHVHQPDQLQPVRGAHMYNSKKTEFCRAGDPVFSEETVYLAQYCSVGRKLVLVFWVTTEL